MEDWGAVRARLEYESEHAVSREHRADIRAALERVEELERERRVSPDDLGVMRDAAGLSERCHELVRRLLKQAQRAEAAERRAAELEETLTYRVEDLRAAEAMLDVANRKLVECGDVWDKQQAEIERLRETLGAILDREELDLKHAYTTCDVGDSTNADRGCIWCVARAALRGER